MDRDLALAPRTMPLLSVRTRDAIVAASLFVVLFAVFWLSPNRNLGDAYYAVLVSESIVRHGHFYLDEHFVPPLDRNRYPNAQPDGSYPYHVLSRDGHVVYAYDPGGPILAIPLVAAVNLFGPSAIAPDGGYDLDGELLIQQILAGGLMAALAALLFATARLVLPLRWSVVVALAAALGTQIWSTASRALWSHTWGVFLFGVVVFILLQQERRGRPLTTGRAALLATVLAWAYFTRPTNAIYIIAVSGYVLYAHRRAFVTFVLVGALWFAVFSLYSLTYVGQILPAQILQASRADSFTVVNPAAVVNTASSTAEVANDVARPVTPSSTGPWGIWLSPSRGLLIFVPIVLFVTYLLVRYRHRLPSGRLALVALIGMAGQIALVSAWRGGASGLAWAGGHSYGPRLLTELVPWLAVLAILGLRAMLDDRSRPGRSGHRLELAVGALLLTLSVAIHARGAVAKETLEWNETPVTVSSDPERLWDWQSPQFLAGLTSPPAEAWLARARREAPTGARLFVEVANNQPVMATEAVVNVDSLTTPTLIVSGWATDEMRQNRAGGVILTFDERTHVVAAYGFDRNDVAEYFGNRRYRFSGFLASIPVSDLGPGRHVMRARVVTTDSRAVYEPEYRLTFDVR
jgi:hypothetical protein